MYHLPRKLYPINSENLNSAQSFSDQSFLSLPSGHGRPRLRVMDVRTDMLVFFQDFQDLTEAFAPARPPSAGYPALKLTLWAAVSLLINSENFKPGNGNRNNSTRTEVPGG